MHVIDDVILRPVGVLCNLIEIDRLIVGHANQSEIKKEISFLFIGFIR